MNIDLMIYLLGNYEGFVFLIGLIGFVSSLTFTLLNKLQILKDYNEKLRTYANIIHTICEN